MARAKLAGRVGGRPTLEKQLEKQGFNINDVIAALSNGATAKDIAKRCGVCVKSVYRLKKKQNEKYKNEINKYFDIQRIKVPGGVEIIQNVRFKNDDVRIQWFKFQTENNKKIILNSIIDKDLKSRILILLDSENFDLVKSKWHFSFYHWVCHFSFYHWVVFMKNFFNKKIKKINFLVPTV